MTCTNPAEISLECYCVARKKPIRCEKTNLQVATVIIAPAGISPRGTLVTRAYIKDSTYSSNIQSVYQKKSRFARTGAAKNR